METRYATLKTVFDLVKEEVSPTHYPCALNQVLVRQNQPWDVLLKHLQLLAAEELVQLRQVGTLQISITDKGIQVAEQMLMRQAS
jgi:predicted transcriptional regulator